MKKQNPGLIATTAAADHQVLCGIQCRANGGDSPFAESSERTRGVE